VSKPIYGRLVLLALLVVGLAGRTYADFLPVDANAERKLGAAINQYMHDTHKFTYRPDWYLRLNTLGVRLALAAGDEARGIHWNYQIIKEPYPNMVSACAGYIYVSSGLMQKGFDDDEMAGIMAHEMTHVIKHHVAKSYMLEYKVLQFDNAVADKAIEDLRMFHHGQAGPYQLYRYAERKLDRDFEREADINGVHIAARAGFNPLGHARALEALLQGKDKPKNLQDILLSTHPPSEERIRRIKEEAARLGKT